MLPRVIQRHLANLPLDPPIWMLLVIVGVSIAEADDGETRPNVLMIAVDDLNDWVGFLGGHPQAQTPNMDRIAQRGTVFTNAHCASPACSPSRAAIFSGRAPWTTGVWSNSSKRLFKQHPDIKTFPDMFRVAGYTTMGTGKLMHSQRSANERLFERHYNVEQRWSPLTRETVRYAEDEQPSKSSNQPRHVVNLGERQWVLPLNGLPSDRNPDNAEGESFDWGPLDVVDREMGDAKITDWAIEQIASSREQPFFLGVGYYRPHIPLWAPARYFERFEHQNVVLPSVTSNDLDDLSDSGRRWAIEAITAGLHSTVERSGQWGDAVKAYLACTTFVDAQIGRLLDALDASPHSDNTLIVLWSDHGWHLGEKQHWGKWTGWERSTRVPLIVVPTKSNVASLGAAATGGMGQRCDAPVSLLDLYPTLAHLCDLRVTDSIDGETLVPLLHDPGIETGRTVVSSLEPGTVAIRDQRWRLIRYDDGSLELYDLQEDPNEWLNLADDQQHLETVRRLMARIPRAALAGSPGVR
ncbi:MAG: sulfatase [Planctomycetota bacterium]